MLWVWRFRALNRYEAPGFCALLRAPGRIAAIPFVSRRFKEKPPNPAAGRRAHHTGPGRDRDRDRSRYRWWWSGGGGVGGVVGGIPVPVPVPVRAAPWVLTMYASFRRITANWSPRPVARVLTAD